MIVPLLWCLCVCGKRRPTRGHGPPLTPVGLWADISAATDSSQPKRYLTMLRMGKRSERSTAALSDVDGDELNDEQYIILYPGRSTPGSNGDRTRQAFFKVPRVGKRATAAQHTELTEKELAKRKSSGGAGGGGYGFDDLNLPLLYDEY